MITAFFHDAPLIQDNNGQVYSVGFTYNLWERYLEVFDSIIVSTRMRIDNSGYGSMTKNMKLSSGPKVEFKPITRYRKNIDRILRKKDITMQIRTTLEKCDCAIIRLPSYIGYIASEQAEKMNKPYLIELVGCPWDAYWNHSLKGKLIAPFMYYTTKRDIRDAPYVSYVSNKFLQSRYPCKGKSLACSDVLLSNKNEDLLSKRLEKIFKMNEDKPILLGTVAAINVRYKGQQYVIKAISKLNKKGYNFEYHLVGGGDQKYLESVARKYGVSDKVKFIGPLPHDKVFDFMQDIDIYIQPSVAESHGRVIIEAMSCACPVIGSSTGGIPELVSSEFVFVRKDVNDLEDKIKKMTKEKMLNDAKRSFEKAQEFDKYLLDKKREAFYSEYAERVESND